MPKSFLRYCGLDKKDLSRADIINWMRKTNTVPSWNAKHGLIFKPHVGRETRKKFQEILQVHSKQDAELLRIEVFGKQEQK